MKRLPLRLLLPLAITLFSLLGVGASVLGWWLQERWAVQERGAMELASRAAQLRAGLEGALLRGQLGLFQRQFGMLGFEPAYVAAAAADPGGRIIASMDRAWVGEPLDSLLQTISFGPAHGARQAPHVHGAQHRSLLEEVRRNGVGRVHLEADGRHLFAAYPLHMPGAGLGTATGILVLVEDLGDEQLHALRGTLAAGLRAALPMLLLAVLLYLLARKRLLAPVERLARAARELGRGRLDVRTGVDGDDELGRLGRAFDAMAARLAADMAEQKRTEERIRASESELRAILENMQDTYYRSDREGVVIRVSPAVRDLLGYSPEEVLGMRVAELYCDPAERDRLKETLERSGGHVKGFEIRLRHRDGHPVWVSASLQYVRDENGEVIGAEGVGRDITDAKRAEEALKRANEQLEDRVRERTRELEAVNRELESFAYSVSHDLRAPLRIIDGFSQSLMEEFADELPAEARASLRRVRAAAHRMGELIEDLLLLSRVTRAEMRRETVDLSALVREIGGRLAAEAPDRAVTFQVEDGLIARGDRALLRVALENLLENAWKYTSRTPAPRIRFFAVDDPDGARAYCVQDNGVGFDPRYAHQLFQPFRRLHRAEEFEGTGIGLATVARIVHRHGGQVRARGNPGQGARFCFTLGEPPAPEQDPDPGNGEGEEDPTVRDPRPQR